MSDEIRILLGTEKDDDVERVHATRVGSNRARIDNVPCFDTHGVHFGDVVELAKLSKWRRQKPGQPYRVKRIVEREYDGRFCVELLAETTATQRADLVDLIQSDDSIVELGERFCFIALRSEPLRPILSNYPGLSIEELSTGTLLTLLTHWKNELGGVGFKLYGGLFPLNGQSEAP